MKIVISNSSSAEFPIEAVEFMAKRGNQWAKDMLFDYYDRLSRPETKFDQEKLDALGYVEWAKQMNSHEWYDIISRELDEKNLRTDPDLIAAVEYLQSIDYKNKKFYKGDLCIVEIPDGIEWEIASNDEFGSEWVVEKHRKWDTKGEFFYNKGEYNRQYVKI